MEREKVIAGNWKMNKTPKETMSFLQEINEKLNQSKHHVVVCVPYLSLQVAKNILKGTKIRLGAQNLHFEEKGAYTGEVSASMLKEVGVEVVIIGHSERRQYFGETDHTVNKKMHTALRAGLRPILCVGESLEQREQGITADIVRMQTKIAFLGIAREQVGQVIIAYEPIWAIGTGKTATKEQANEVCRTIRNCVQELYGQNVAEAIIIQYGGSVTSENAKELFEMEDIDGGLVGGASLKSDFIKIANFDQ